MRALLLALEETAGPSSVTSVLELAGLDVSLRENLPPQNLEKGFTFQEIAAFNQALESVYGTRGGRGIALRAGTRFFELGLRETGVLKGVSAPEFGRLPTPQRAKLSLMGLAHVFSTLSSQTTHIEERPDAYNMIVNPSPFAWERVSDKPVCHILTGATQATLRWATDGHEYAVYETACQAMGAANCVFHVSKRPIGRV